MSRIPTLNDVPPELVRELRGLERHDADSLLARRLAAGREHQRLVPAFVDEVVHGGADAATWGRRDLLVVADEGARDPLFMSADWLRRLVAPVVGERWVRLAVADAAEVERRADEPFWGSPGVLVRDAAYHFVPPPGAVTVVADGPLERIADLEVALRRWIARRAAWRARRLGVELARVETLAPAGASNDARLALRGLAAEARLPFDPARQVRGFAAPDAVYRSS
jgi:hypothetical protein